MFELAERWDPSDGPDSRALIARMREAGRAEARAGAARLDAIGELFELRRVERGESADWAVDTWAAVGAEVAAALRTSLAMAGSYLHYARTMRERLPAVAEVFRAGEIDFRLFQTLVYRTDLISEPEVLATADARLAVRARRWPSMTRGRLAGEIDRVVGAIDPDAVRRRAQEVSDRSVSIWESSDGMSELNGRLMTPHASALDERLDALAGTVCAGDPRTREQRRADALGALAANAVRLDCRCGTSDCPAGGAKPSSSVVIHVLAEQATVEGRGQAPGSLLGADTVLPAEVIAELAQSARLRPLDVPYGAESGYVPSAGLAAFVRARDLTCRAPGCDRPASQADIDHTVPYADGGPTHPSNLKCLCRHHHLLKTFWGWRDQQLPDGTVIWRLPGNQTYVTTPGSVLLFPSLCAPTGDLTPAPPAEHCAQRLARMPLRNRTRAQNRTQAIAAERRHNRDARMAARAESVSYRGLAPPDTADDEPPPF